MTGGIGSGKSYVAHMFINRGIPTYFADKEAKRLMNAKGPLKETIKKLLGKDAYHSNGRLHRAYVASLIFENKSLLKAINSLVHPAVKDDFIVWADNQKAPYVLEESAILYENGLQTNFDQVIVVTAPKEIRIRRVINRESATRKQVLSRIKQQLPDEKKIALANFVIINDGDSDLDNQIDTIHRELMKISVQKK